MVDVFACARALVEEQLGRSIASQLHWDERDEWAATELGGRFVRRGSLRLERGTLARIAVAIAEAESNILNVNMEDENAEQAQINFKLQVRDRRHLARVMRMLRRVPQVSRVLRVKPGDRSGAERSTE